jgi:hypothetical protein
MPRFRLYRLFLKLYPRSFRQEYGEEMVQTLADMLDDQPDTVGRWMVWLRVGIELPLSALQETITSRGENTVDKLSFVNNKRLLAGSVVAVAIILSFVFHGWVQGSATPYVTGLFYRHGLQTKVEDQNKAIGQPFEALASKDFNPTSTCGKSLTSGLKVRVECNSQYMTSFKVGQSTAQKAHMLQAAQITEEKLKTAGYTAGSNGVTLTSLIEGTYEGKDYSPDAFYQKTIGSTTCTFDTNIAYSRPSQPALTMILACSRSIHVFGKISDAVQP